MYRPTAIWSATTAIAVAAALALAPSGSYADAARIQHHIVEIQNLQFSPKELTVAPGDTITWINKDFVPHTATADGRDWDSGTVGTEDRWQMTVQEDQGGPYFCRFHPSMVGRLVIADR